MAGDDKEEAKLRRREEAERAAADKAARAAQGAAGGGGGGSWFGRGKAKVAPAPAGACGDIIDGRGRGNGGMSSLGGHAC